MRLLDKLREKDKKGIFEASYAGESYMTGFLPFDYRNGYILSSINSDDQLIVDQQILGVPGGCFITIVGKSGTAKSTFAMQLAVKMIEGFSDGIVIHYDLEQATTYTRVKNVTGASQKVLKTNYILKQGTSYIQDIFNSIMIIAKEKESLKDELMYDTGKLDEFGLPIKVFQPTVVIVDSIPTLSSKDTEDSVEMQGATYSNRIAREISQFYTRLMPVIKPYNITVIAINHIKSKIEINPMMKTQPQLLYMKMDESMPGGFAPIYYAHLLTKFVTSGKRTVEKDGFDGMDVNAILLKSRTNKAGQQCTLVYNQVSGFSRPLTLLRFAEENNLVSGRNPHLYFIGDDTVKFNRNKFEEEFYTREELGQSAIKTCIPVLTQQLSANSRSTEKNLDILTLIERLEHSQKNEEFVEESE